LPSLWAGLILPIPVAGKYPSAMGHEEAHFGATHKMAGLVAPTGGIGDLEIIRPSLPVQGEQAQQRQQGQPGVQCYVPIANGLDNLRNKAIAESGVSRPVRGFSRLGTFSICIEKRAASASTSMR
jgi:hypothetical protein